MRSTDKQQHKTQASRLATLGALSVLVAIADPNGGLLDIPFSFILKNKLGLDAHQAALFRAIAAAPLYVSFLFGLARDRLNPLGLRDRGWIMLFAGAGVALNLGFACAPASIGVLLAANLLMTAAFLFVAAAQSGLTTLFARQHSLTGRISALSNALGVAPGVLALALGGYLSLWLDARDIEGAVRALFFIGAFLSALVGIYVAWGPRALYRELVYPAPAPVRLRADLLRLLRAPGMATTMAIWLLWNFAPGSSTPLQYHMQNALGANDAQWGEWNAIFAASFAPTFLLFGWACKRWPLKRLLYIGAFVAIGQFSPLMFVTSASGALWAAAPMGLMGGLITAALMDLMMRAAPAGLQGATMMLASAAYFVSARLGDLLGAALYEKFGGFGICVALTTGVYAAIAPLLKLLPDALINYADGETPPPDMRA